MTASLYNAINAYKSTANIQVDPQENQAAANGVSGDGFSKAIQDVVGKTAEPLHKAEDMMTKSLMKQVDVSDVVTAVTQAELMLKTVVNIRDRLVSAHQEILRMPI
jgi:flagellar hook-basal body complex protein FliE